MAETVLLVGGGGREHALAIEMGRSDELDHIYCAPGNAGTSLLEKAENMPFGPSNLRAIVDFAVEKSQTEDLTVVVGPEAPLVAGLADQLQSANIPVFGPTAAAAALEGSKIFARKFMLRNSIPQPHGRVVRTMEEARQMMLDRRPEEIVIKADGLAGGKGVDLPTTTAGALETFRMMLSGEGFDGAGNTGVVVQERLHGPELSVFVISDGVNHSVIPFFAQDHKRLRDGDYGPNTGGMGAYTPISEDMLSGRQYRAINTIAARTIDGMADQGIPYQGVLYIGKMQAEERGDDPVVIEYNCRFGDPEAEVILPLLTKAGFDVYRILYETARGHVPDLGTLRFAGGAALTVCLAAEGYPDKPQKGEVIRGLDQPYADVTIHHGGTKLVDNNVITDGGRVLFVTGHGETVDSAAAAAYAAIGNHAVHFAGMQYRTDIGWQVRSAT